MNGNIPLIYYERKVKTRRYNEYLRDNLDPFNISYRCFIDTYRMPKRIVNNLIEEIKPHIEESTNVSKTPLHLEVLAALNFYASGSHQRRVGLNAFATMSQSKISSSIAKISEVIGKKLIHKYVVFPKSVAAAKIKKDEFFNKYGIPGVVGLVDGTHIAVANMPKNDEYAYVNRKNFHSINTQVICDLNLRILISLIKQIAYFNYILGDSGYALKPFMMVPYRRPSTDEQQKFNSVHNKVRNSIERCFGVLKSRFRCIKRQSGYLHFSHKKITHIIYSCATLHNLLVDNNYPIYDVGDDGEEYMPTRDAEEADNSGDPNRAFLTNLINERN